MGLSATSVPFELFDYVNDRGDNDFKEWTKKLQKPERAKLNARLDMLQQHGSELFPEILTGTPTPGILKLRVKGKVQLRPMLCKGPLNHNSEFTLLIGATERDFCFEPKHADQIANDRKQIITENHHKRREHERIS